MPRKIARQPPRYADGHGLFFLTFCTYHRAPILHDKGIPELLIRSFEFYSSRLKELIAYTIMPNHLHLIVAVETVEEVSSFLRDFKKYTSKEIKRLKGF
ncbi:MAG: transposase [Bacteroidota bacterium]